jgi:hypothetical protein
MEAKIVLFSCSHDIACDGLEVWLLQSNNGTYFHLLPKWFFVSQTISDFLEV